MPKDWPRIEELFHQAAALASGERSAFLAQACGSDPAVLVEVESLLAANNTVMDLPPAFITGLQGLTSGDRLGGYEIEALCGQGATGTVYRARDTRNGATVAIKVFPPLLSAEQRRRYLKEARAASVVDHPAVVKVLEAASADNRDFLVMEYVEGQTLGEVIPPKGLTVEAALAFARLILQGLSAAHSAGIIHRDLKPSNIMVSPSGAVKILDFGLAKVITPVTPSAPGSSTGPETQLMSAETTAGQILGTVCYLSPEQAEGQPVDVRTDVFSFGVVLYELLTGARPFDRGSLAGTLSAILRDTPVAVRKLRSATPRDVARLIARSLQKDREKRFASAGEFLRALLVCQAGLETRTRRATRFLRPKILAPAAVGLALILAGAGWSGTRWLRIRHARRTIEPRIVQLVGNRLYNAADELVCQIEKTVPHDQAVRDFIRDYRIVTSVTTTPAGTEVAIRDYGTPDAPWRVLGKAPLQKITIPLGYFRWRVSLPGYRTREFAETGMLQTNIRFALHREAGSPADMELVPAGLTYGRHGVKVPEFWMDRFEVTNRRYQEFVAGGEYRKPEFWQEPFVGDGKTLTREQAMSQFTDQTGRPGPADWQEGRYPEGKGDYPVTGVSWYEAAAYARFAKKRLPAYLEWQRAARTEWLYADALLESNFSGKSLSPAGSYHGLDRFGTYNLFGNCKEWIWNEYRPGQRMVMGGAWDEMYYAARAPDLATPMERRANIGFRCARSAGQASDAPPPPAFLGAVQIQSDRDYSREKPVDDATFAGFRKQFDYNPAPLHQKSEEIDDSNPYWRKEKVSFDAVYGGQRVTAFLFLPRSAPPYQTVVYFASGIALSEKSTSHLEMWFLEPLIRSGRAVLYPILWDMYDRKEPVKGSSEDRLRTRMVRDVQDMRRALDYLETRPEIDRAKLAYFGFSYGALFSPLVLGTESRFKVAELAVGGLLPDRVPMDFDPFQFAPRVRIPVLMMNGRYDLAYGVETSQKPLLNTLGTPPADKKLVLLEAGHAMVGFPASTRESLDWLDRYLGPVPVPVLPRQ